MTNFDDVLARLNPSTREKVRLASEVKDDRARLPSIGLTKATSGGFKYGGQAMVWGNRSGGKTLLTLGAMGIAQAEGRTIALIDAERTYTPEWGAKFGINSDQMIHSKVASINEVTEAGMDFMRSGVDFIAIDSISALLPGSYFDDGEMKAFGNTGQIGQFSKDTGKMLGMFNYTNESTALVLISQVRTDLSGYHASLKPMGGKATEHYNDLSIKLWSSLSEKEQIKGTVTAGDHIYEQGLGRPVKWFMDKARGPGMGTEGQYDMYYAGDNIGIDRVGEILDYGVLYGIIKKGGAWLTIGEERFQGRPKAVEWLRQNPDAQKELEEKILA